MLHRFMLLAAVFSLAACSSSQKQPEQDLLELNGTESSADAVGSIPEDMLSAEEPGSNSELATSDKLDDGASEDPFADLKEKEPVADLSTDDGDSAGSVATTGESGWYSVKTGDTLMKIAFTIYGDLDRWKDLFDWNRATLKRASQLDVGLKLKYEIPVQNFEREKLGHSYKIKQGDTLAGIADEVYGRKQKYKKLQNYNKRLIKNPNRIFAGFTIFYDITEQEVAEADARRKERLAQGGGRTDLSGGNDSIPSAISPPEQSAPQAPAPVAVTPPAPSSLAPPPPPPPSGP